MPESIIKLGSDINMRSRHKEEIFNMYVGSLITWYNTNCDVMLSITFPPKADLN